MSNSKDAADYHCSEQGRQARLIRLLSDTRKMANGTDYGIGIDEGTGILITDVGTAQERGEVCIILLGEGLDFLIAFRIQLYCLYMYLGLLLDQKTEQNVPSLITSLTVGQSNTEILLNCALVPW